MRSRLRRTCHAVRSSACSNGIWTVCPTATTCRCVCGVRASCCCKPRCPSSTSRPPVASSRRPISRAATGRCVTRRLCQQPHARGGPRAHRGRLVGWRGGATRLLRGEQSARRDVLDAVTDANTTGRATPVSPTLPEVRNLVGDRDVEDRHGGIDDWHRTLVAQECDRGHVGLRRSTLPRCRGQ